MLVFQFMTGPELIETIGLFVNNVRRNKGLSPILIDENSSLLDGQAGFDSLDLAALVVELQNASGQDPFEHGFVNFSSAGELAALFAARQA
jgi:acyl carrier protein